MASSTLEQLVVRIDADTSRLQRELQKADRSVDKFDKSSAKSMKRFDLNLKSAERSVSMFRNGLLAIGAAGGALALMGRQAIKTADDIGNVADKLGLSAERLQEYRHAAEQVGVAQGTLDLALQRFTRRMAEAAQGQGELKGILEQYGIAVRDSNGRMRDADDVLRDLSTAMGGAENQAERLRIAFKAFDSEGADLVRLFGGGTAAVDQFIDRARELGVIINESLIREAQEANQKLGEMEQIMGVHLLRAGLTLVPLMKRVAESFSKPEVIAGLEDMVDLLTRFIDLTERAAIGASYLWGSGAQNADIAAARMAKIVIEMRTAQRILSELQNDQFPDWLQYFEINATKDSISALTDEYNKLADVIKANQGSDLPVGTSNNPPATANPVMTPTGKANQEMRYEIQALEDLIAARQRGTEAYRATARAIDIEKRARAENIDLSTKEGQEWARLAEQQMKLQQTQSGSASVMDAAQKPLQRYTDEVSRLEKMLKAGAISQQAFDVSVETARETLISTDPVLKALGDSFDSLSEGIVQSMTSGEDAMDAFRQTAKRVVDDLLQEFFRLTVMQPIKNAIFGSISGGSLFSGLGGLFGGGGGSSINHAVSGAGQLNAAFDKGGVIAGGRAVAGGRVINYDKGGVYERPTSFPMAAGAMGRIGEGDHAEAALPLVRLPDGAYGVRASGGGRGGPAVVVNQSNNFQLGLAPTVRAELMNMMPMIAEKTTEAVASEATRGGPLADMIRGTG